jgi:hypothetical protein
LFLGIKLRRRGVFIFSVVIFAFLIDSSAFALAQDQSKPNIEKWRPKDGAYIEAGTAAAGRCEAADPFIFALSRKKYGIEERYGCTVTKITDTAPGALRLDMTCNESENADDGEEEGKNSKEVMTLRKINENSFFMRVTVKGKFPRPEWRVDPCPPALNN